MINKISILSFILVGFILFLNSCSTSNLTVNKKRYSKGYYVNFNKNNKKALQKDIVYNSNIKDKTVNNKVIEKVNSNTLSSSLENTFFESTENNSINNKSNTTIIKTSKKQKKLLNKIAKLNKFSNKYDDEPDKKEARNYALLSFIFGISGFLLIYIGILLAVTATILGYLALKQYQKLTNFKERKWMAILGLSLGIATVLLYILAISIFIFLILAL